MSKKVKKIPLRKCVISNERLPKASLIRIVRTPENEVKIDLTGKLNGRGAYLKRSKSVINKASQTKKLDRHLETTVPMSIYEDLLKMLEDGDL
ncbi:MAG: RNase P modulator RnpM [Candidatus Izemoplasmataceae bacterium]